MPSMKITVFWSFVTQYGQMIVTFVTSIILARLLSPTEIGIYSVSYALIGFATLFRDFGVSDYLVQEKNLSEEKLRTAFTFNNLIAWSLGAAVFVIADPVAAFYEKNEIANVLKLLSVNFLLVPIGAVTFAVLRRNMNFKSLANIQLIGIVLTASTSIVAALLGQSYLSMAWGAIAGSLSTAIICQFYRPEKLSIRPTLSGLKHIWAYSSFSVVFTLVRHTSGSLSGLLTGKFLGMADVGLLSKSRALPSMVLRLLAGGIKPVIMPAFSEISEDKALMSTQYFRVVNITLCIVWPSLLFLACMSNEVVMLLFGINWIAIAPLIKLTCIAASLWATINYADEVFKATGNISVISKLEPLFLVLAAAAAIIGSQINLQALIVLGFFGTVIRVIIYLRLLDAMLNISIRTYLEVILRNLLLSILLFLSLYIFTCYAVFQNPFYSLVASGSFYSLLWLSFIFIGKHELSMFIGDFFVSLTKKGGDLY